MRPPAFLLAACALLLVAAGAAASDAADWKALKGRYEKASKRHDNVGMIERKHMIQDMLEFLDQKACRKYLRGIYGDERVIDNRVAVVQVLGASPNVKDLDFLVKSLGSKKERHRAPIIALGEGLAFADPAAHADLAPRAIHHARKAKKKDDLRLALLEGVAHLEEAKLHGELLALAEKAEPRDLFEIYIGVGRHGREDAVDALVAAAGSSDFRPVLGATIGLVETGSAKATPKLVELLGNPDPLVNEIAARALGDRKHKDATDALVDLLEAAPLRGREVVRAALRDITGKDCGHDAAAWRKTLAGKQAEPDKVKLPTFFGVEIATDRAVAFLDLSRSMSFNNRLGRAQDGLVEFIDSLPPEGEIGVYGMTRSVRSYAQEPVAVGSGKEKVKLWLREQLHAGGGLDMKSSLLDALEKHPDADTFVIATDSQPRGTGSDETAFETIEIFRQANRVRQIRVVVAFVTPGGRFEEQETHPEEFEDTKDNLRILAENSGGRFIDIDK